MDDVIRVYGASWCPDCRRAKRFLGDQRISFEWHDIEVDPDEVRTVQERNDGNNIIPTIIFPDGSHLSEPSNEELAEKIGLERMATMHVYDLIIVGGGPAGLTTSIYAARENLQTLVIDSKGLGGQAGVTERLDNYPGFPEGIGGAELADRIVQQAQRYGVEMLQAVLVRSISSDGEEVDVETATGDHYHARAALIATGSTYRMTGAPGEDDLIGAGIHFCATCDGPFYKGANQLVVLGGGNSGLEEGLFLTQFVDKVTIVQRGDRLTANKLLQDKVMMTPSMEVLLNREVVEFRPKDDGSGKLGRGCPQEPRHRGHRGAASRRRVRLHRARPEHRVRRGLGGPGRPWPDRHRHGSADEHAGRLRRGRRAFGLDQAAGVGGRRGRCGRDRDSDVPRGARRQADAHDVTRRSGVKGASQGSEMEPQKIFEIIIKADEKLKYAHEDNAGLRRQQARDLLVQARAAATEIGNDALVQQADTRLADLEKAEPAG